MPEAVIVSTARSPIGRAFKGSLKNIRPDDLAVQMIKAATGKIGLTGAGRRRRGRLRRAARRARRQHGPPDRRTAGLGQHARDDGEPVLRLLGADRANGVPRDQGRRGRRVRQRRRRVRVAVHELRLGRCRRPELRSTRCSPTRCSGPRSTPRPTSTWHDPREDGQVPDIYIAMGQTAENVANLKGISRADQDEFGVRSQNLRRGVDQERLLRARDRPRSRCRTAPW